MMSKLEIIKLKAKSSSLKRLNMSLFQRNSVVYLKMFLNGKSLSFSTGIICRKANLDTTLFSVTNDDNATSILQGLRTDIQRAYTDFVLTKRVLDLREIRDVALNVDRNKPIPTVIECLDKFLQEEFILLEGIEYQKKTVDKKKYIVERIKEYILNTYGNKYLRLTSLKPIDGNNLVNFCKKKFNHGHNHAVLHAEFFKRTLNYAIAHEWLDKNPLAFLSPRRERKPVLVLKESDITKLEKYQFQGREYNYVKDVFLFCCYTGLSYVDIYRLDSSYIFNDSAGKPLIKIQRGKNGNQCIIPLVPQALQLINKYANNPDSLFRNKLFPVYSNQAMNRILKEIQVICNLPIRLTTHVARKTCASYYIANGVPLTSVAAMLGHSKTSTTELYYTQRSEDAVIKHLEDFQKRKNFDTSGGDLLIKNI